MKPQIKAAPTDQKASLQAQRVTDPQQQRNSGKLCRIWARKMNKRAMILGNLGNANECAGKYQDAANTFQKAIDTKPIGGYYVGLATNLANAGAASTDPKAADAKFADASAACEKATALDPRLAPTAGKIWASC